MTHDANTLLRMLEPAVRPVGTPAPSRPAVPPIEQQDFAALLAEAGAGASVEDDAPAGPAEADAPPAAAKRSTGPLAALSGIDAIDNVSLRGLAERPRPGAEHQ
ncbi:MAG: hypothetical protein WD009_02490 [Phycisphaeraceae bacterium]